jgi:hypothetical protein
MDIEGDFPVCKAKENDVKCRSESRRKTMQQNVSNRNVFVVVCGVDPVQSDCPDEGFSNFTQRL